MVTLSSESESHSLSSSVSPFFIQRFGKSSDGVRQVKANWYCESLKFLADQQAANILYQKQPKRLTCKNCDESLFDDSHHLTQFSKKNTLYLVCGRCGHLNGAHEDTEVFCAYLYQPQSENSLTSTYQSVDPAQYCHRVSHIYRPKVQFLMDVLNAQSEDPRTLSYTDFGAGMGYFVSALSSAGLSDVHGREVSPALIEMGKPFVPEGAIEPLASFDCVVEAIGNTKSDVVSMIGVLEHVRDPRGVLAAIQKNPSIRYVYLSLPLFNFSVLFELMMASQNVMERQLIGGHTHLYTDESIAYFSKEFGLTRCGEWWFGADMMDLHRTMGITLRQNGAVDLAERHLDAMLLPALDGMQKAMDEKKLSSEVHLVLKKS